MKRLLSVFVLLAALAVVLPAPARAICFQAALAMCDSGCSAQWGTGAQRTCPRAYTEQYCVDAEHACAEDCLDENCPDGRFATY